MQLLRGCAAFLHVQARASAPTAVAVRRAAAAAVALVVILVVIVALIIMIVRAVVEDVAVMVHRLAAVAAAGADFEAARVRMCRRAATTATDAHAGAGTGAVADMRMAIGIAAHGEAVGARSTRSYRALAVGRQPSADDGSSQAGGIDIDICILVVADFPA